MHLPGKKYSHHCFVGGFKFSNKENKEAQFIETIGNCCLYQHLLEPKRNRSILIIHR